ncbi:MAG: hypothetical protein IIW87_09480, partial [Alistipes sp.]|nr:hypothetical protein [Alistipes sp.]
MKGKFMIIAALLGALTFGACVDNNESASVENVRNAKAEELKAQAALLNAEAQAKVILANAEAALKASQAAINQAEAAIKEAEARLAEAKAEAQEIENEGKLAELEAKIAEYEATIAYQQMLKAKWFAQMETDAVKAEQALLEAQLELIKQEREFNKKLDEFAKADAQKLRGLYSTYVMEASKLNRAISKVNQIKNNIAKAEAGLVKIDELVADFIEYQNAEIAEAEAAIVELEKVLAVFEEAHADEILTDEEVAELKAAAYVELAKLVEASAVAMDNVAAAQKVATAAQTAEAEAYDAFLAVSDAANEESAMAALNEAKTAYLSAVNALVVEAKLSALRDDSSDATGNGPVTAWGFYSDSATTGVNSVFNAIVTAPEGDVNKFVVEDEENHPLLSTFVHGLYTLNEENLAVLVAEKKEMYSEENMKAYADAVEAATENLAAAQAAYEAAVKAVADTKAAIAPAKAAAEAESAAWAKLCAEFELVTKPAITAKKAALKNAEATAAAAKDAADAAMTV